MATKRQSRSNWLMKSEPGAYSFDDLLAEPDQVCCWDGVRNYQARNLLRDELKKGDRVLFYHSSATPPHVAGVAEVVREGYPDHTATDPSEPHFDPKSDPEQPRWFMVDIKAVRALERIVPLAELKESAKLKQMLVVQKGQRLSVQRVTDAEFEEVLRLARASA